MASIMRRLSASPFCTALHVIVALITLATSFGPPFGGGTARAQDLVPAPPDMKLPEGDSAPLFAPLRFPAEIEDPLLLRGTSSDLLPSLGRHLGGQTTEPQVARRDEKKVDKQSGKDRLAEAEASLNSSGPGNPVELFSLVIAYDHDSVKGHLGRARGLMAQRRYKLALEDVDFVIARDPDHLEAHELRAFCFLHFGIPDGARSLEAATTTASKLLKHGHAVALARALRGVIALVQKDLDLAVAELSYAIDNRLDWPDARAYRGLAFMAKGDFRRALDDFNCLAGRRSPRDVQSAVLYARGRCHAAVGEFDLAIADFTVLIERHPDQAKYYQFRADAYVKKKDLTRALADHDQLVRLQPASAEAYFRRAILRAWNRQSALAIADMDRMLQLEPLASGAYFCRAVIFMLGNGDVDRALADMERAFALGPPNSFFFGFRGYLHAKKLQSGPALKDFVHCFATLPELDFKLTWNRDDERGTFSVRFDWRVKEDANQNQPPIPRARKRPPEASNFDSRCVNWGVGRILAAALEPRR